MSFMDVYMKAVQKEQAAWDREYPQPPQANVDAPSFPGSASSQGTDQGVNRPDPEFGVNQAGGNAGIAITPFQAYKTMGFVNQVYISEGILMIDRLDLSSGENINGLLTSFSVPSAGDIIHIECSFTPDGSFSSADILQGKWTGYPDAVRFDIDGNQTHANAVICETVAFADADTTVPGVLLDNKNQVQQRWFGNMLLAEGGTADGFAYFIVPFGGAAQP